jgi:magnesium transporter
VSTLGPEALSSPVTDFADHEPTTLGADQTVGDALDSLRGRNVAESIVYFYVIDRDERLVGVVPTRRLLMSPLAVRVSEIMVRHVIAIPARATLADACEFFTLHRLLAFPVVDRERRILGVISVRIFADEVFDLAERQSTTDVFQLIGVRLALARKPSPWSAFKGRFPWLLCNIAGGIACAFLVSRYETFLNDVIVLALFVPVVLALSESVSMQSMTITLQGLHEGRVDWHHLARSVGVELATALLLGSACGAVVGLVAWAWKGGVAIALAIGASIALSIVTACLLGVLLPTTVRALRGDPRIAAGPIVLATADLATLLFYFNLSGLLLD